MEIKIHDVTIRELVEGYRDEGDDGVFGYGGKTELPNGQMLCHDCNWTKGKK